MIEFPGVRARLDEAQRRIPKRMLSLFRGEREMVP